MRASSTWLALLLIGCGNSPGGPTGAGGTTGSTGRAGTTGSAGSVGSAGTTGTGATTGIGGSAGIGGVGGSAGIGGVGGSAGIGGVGGSAGTTGVAGITGASGTTGLGGSPCQPSLPSDCGAAMCGNGKRDTCMLPGGTGSCPLVQVTEACDGNDFGTASCVGMGYGSGKLSCRGNCLLNLTSCSDCTSDAHVVACGPLDLASDQVRFMGIAATDKEIGLVYARASADMWFARLSADGTILNGGPLSTTQANLGGIALGTLPAGWVIATAAWSDLLLDTLNATGEYHVGRKTIEAIPFPTNSFAPPALASRPNAGPLLVWEGTTMLRATIVAADGKSLSAPVDLPIPSGNASLSAAWVGDAFYVAVTNPSDQLRLVRVGADGTVGTVINALPGVKARRVRLTTGAGDLRVVYAQEIDVGTTETWKMYWQKLAPTGAAATDPVLLWGPLSFSGGSFDVAGPVAFDGDTVALLLSNGASGVAIQAVRIGPSGTIVTAPFTVGQHPYPLTARGTDQLLARRGTEAIVGWPTDRDIRTARLAP